MADEPSEEATEGDEAVPEVTDEAVRDLLQLNTTRLLDLLKGEVCATAIRHAR